MGVTPFSEQEKEDFVYVPVVFAEILNIWLVCIALSLFCGFLTIKNLDIVQILLD